MVMYRPQFTYPESNDLPGIGSDYMACSCKPFRVRSVDLEACICKYASPGHNFRCSYHDVLKIKPEKRTKAMEAVIKSQELALEAGRLLLSTRAYTYELDEKRLCNLRGSFETSNVAAVIEKSIVKLIRAALLHHGSYNKVHHPCAFELSVRLGFVGISADFERPLESNETLLDRAKSLSWLHLLAAVPIIMAHSSVVEPKRWIAAVQTASIALALMEQGSSRWQALLASQGISLWDYELVVRMHQSHAVFMMAVKLPKDEVKKIYTPIFKANAERVYSVDPINYQNLIYCNKLGVDKGKQCQVSREALKVADNDGDDSKSIILRWLLCQAILLGFEGPSFSLGEVLSITREARAAMGRVESWIDPETMVPHIMWPCLGVAARYRATIKEDPSFEQSMMEAYASLKDLESEKRHVKCASCDELCYPLKRCSGCHLVGYCSKKCQIMDWKAGHKDACKQHSKPDSQCSA